MHIHAHKYSFLLDSSKHTLFVWQSIPQIHILPLLDQAFLQMVYCTLQNTHPNTFKGRVPELSPHNSHGDFHCNTLDGILLINAATVKIVCPHSCFVTFIEIIMFLVTSRRCLFFLSATPFFAGVYGHVV